MTPADILAAARLSPLSPVVPAREEWLAGWQGPAEFMFAGFGPHPGVVYAMTSTGHVHGVIWIAAGPSLESAVFHLDNVRIDLRRPEVRDRIVRCGVLPVPLRDHVAAALASTYVDAGEVRACAPWTEDAPELWWRHAAVRGTYATLHSGPTGWAGMERSPGRLAHGTETGAAGRAACDLDALSRGCVLEEPDGWYIPLPGGAVGWLPKESA